MTVETDGEATLVKYKKQACLTCTHYYTPDFVDKGINVKSGYCRQHPPAYPGVKYNHYCNNYKEMSQSNKEEKIRNDYYYSNFIEDLE